MSTLSLCLIEVQLASRVSVRGPINATEPIQFVQLLGRMYPVLAWRGLHAAPKVSGWTVPNSRKVARDLLEAPPGLFFDAIVLLLTLSRFPGNDRGVPSELLRLSVEQQVVANIAVLSRGLVLRVAFDPCDQVSE